MSTNLQMKNVKDSYLIPRIDDEVNTLVDSKLFGSGANSGFWHVELDPKDKDSRWTPAG